jgi:flagellar FliJ protein
MEPVIRIAAERERAAARRLGEARGYLQQQQQRQTELLDYHREYAQRFREAGSIGLGGAQLQSYRVFLAQLDQAIDYQRGVVTRSEEVVAARLREWHETRTRLKALDKVVERYQAEERRCEERREQSETDERAQRFGRD